MTPLNNLKNESPPTAPVLESVAIAPPEPAALSEPELNRPASQKASVPLEPTLSAATQASGSRDAQLQTHDQQLHRHTSRTTSGQGASTTHSPSNEQPVQQSKPSPKGAAGLATASIDQLTAFWEKYNAIGDKEDREFVASAGGDLDNLLIFAGLFSAIDTAFILESYKALKPDPADEATKLLRSIVLLLRDPRYTDESATQSFSATTRDIRVNCLLFASLCCSLSAAFGAVLAKQWLTQYDRDGGGSLKTPAHRGRERQGKYDGRNKWHLEDVIVTLPTLLQCSLFLFLVGLADFIWPLNTLVASIIVVFASVTFLYYTITISISVIDRHAPFQTRLSTTLASFSKYLANGIRNFYKDNLEHLPHWVWPLLLIFHVEDTPHGLIFYHARYCENTMAWLGRTYRSITARSTGKQETAPSSSSIESRCVVHLLERISLSEDLDILAEAIDSLPNNSGALEIAEALATFHLKPTVNNGQWRFHGLHSQSLGAMTKILHNVSGNWEYSELSSSSINYTPWLHDLRMREELILALWDAFLAHPDDQGVYDSTRRIYLTLSRGEIRSTTSTSEEFLSRAGVMANLKTAAAQEPTFRLLCLLPSIGCHLDHTMELLRTTASESPQLMEKLQSTMWEGPDHRPDLEIFWLATFRVEALSSYRLDILVDSNFPEYLASWFNQFSVPDWRARLPDSDSFRHSQSWSQQLSLYWTYLFSLCHLLKHDESRTWSHKLAKTGHLSCLRVILQDYPHDRRFCGEPLGLWALLGLWNLGEVQGGSGTSLFLTKDCFHLVSESIRACGSRSGWIAEMVDLGMPWDFPPKIWTSKMEAAEDVAQMLDWLLSYLVAAKEGGLLDEGVARSTVQTYSGWCTEVNSLLPEDRQHADRSEELRTLLLGNLLA